MRGLRGLGLLILHDAVYDAGNRFGLEVRPEGSAWLLEAKERLGERLNSPKIDSQYKTRG